LSSGKEERNDEESYQLGSLKKANLKKSVLQRHYLFTVHLTALWQIIYTGQEQGGGGRGGDDDDDDDSSSSNNNNNNNNIYEQFQNKERH
jgi:hypothetical protein